MHIISFISLTTILASCTDIDLQSHKHQNLHKYALRRHPASKFDLHKRQVNSPVEGIGIFSSSENAVSTTRSSYQLSNISTSWITVSSASNESRPSYIFPTTVMQVPIATICPDPPFSSSLWTFTDSDLNGTTGTGAGAGAGTSSNVNSSSNDVSIPNTNVTYAKNTSSSTRPTPATYQTGFLPLNNSYDGINLTQSNLLPPEMARILMDPNGCQTLFSPITTALCQTTLYLPGIGPTRVTECEQYITFSSQVQNQAVASCPTLTSSQKLQEQSMRTTYYAAKWYDLIPLPSSTVAAGIPNLVRVEDCPSRQLYQTNQNDCIISTESWSMSTSTLTTTGTTAAYFYGPAAILSGINSIPTTTTISLNSTFTATAEIVVSSIIRIPVVSADTTMRTTNVASETTDDYVASSDENTVTIYLSIPTTVATRTLELKFATTVTSKSTMTMTRTFTSVVTVFQTSTLH